MRTGRTFPIGIAATVALIVLGVVLVLMGDDALSIVGAGVLGVAAVVALSLVFLAVGYSEDREREAEARDAAAAQAEQRRRRAGLAPREGAESSRLARRPRSPRRRGE